MRWSIQGKLVLGSALTLALMGLLCGLAYRNTRRMSEAFGLAIRTQTVLMSLEAVLSTMKDAETGERGFLLTGREELLAPYLDAQRRVGERLDAVRLRVVGSPAQERRVGRLAELIAREFGVLQKSIDLRRSVGAEAALQAVEQGRGKAVMDEIRRTIGAMEAEERERLARREADVAAWAGTATATYVVLVVMVVALLVLGSTLVAHDVAQQRKSEEALRASEFFYHSLVETLPQNIFRKDREGRFTFVNRRFCETLGRSAEELLGRGDLDFFPKALAAKYRADDARVMATGEGIDAIEEHVTPDGHIHYVHVMKTPLYDRSGAVIGIQGIFWDETARRRAEKKLEDQNVRLRELAESERRALEDLKGAQSLMVETAKLAGLGQMVAGVAHEINNPLAYVSNNVAVLQRDLADLGELLDLYRQVDAAPGEAHSTLRERIREVAERVDLDYTLENLPGLLARTREGLGRIRKIVENLRAFARLDEGDLDEVDLNAGIESTATIVLGSARAQQVRLELDLDPLPPVTCYPTKINQVVLNLASNAIDACSEGGRVDVRTRAEPGGVRIEVEDDGTGIAPEVRERIFEPFFTTKPIGVGTGLGLSISYGIVRDHGGTIDVESAPGRGSLFTVHLPLRVPSAPAAEGAPAHVGAGPRGESA
jgi:PAS domain S-box-containing protein